MGRQEHRIFAVTLVLRSTPENGVGHPDLWNWPDLLDLRPEDVRLVEVRPVASPAEVDPAIGACDDCGRLHVTADALDHCTTCGCCAEDCRCA